MACHAFNVASVRLNDFLHVAISLCSTHARSGQHTTQGQSHVVKHVTSRSMHAMTEIGPCNGQSAIRRDCDP